MLSKGASTYFYFLVTYLTENYVVYLLPVATAQRSAWEAKHCYGCLACLWLVCQPILLSYEAVIVRCCRNVSLA